MRNEKEITLVCLSQEAVTFKDFLLVCLCFFVCFFLDLVPKENVEAWLKHLRMELPTVAFKASTQEQQKRLVHAFLRNFLKLLCAQPVLVFVKDI